MKQRNICKKSKIDKSSTMRNIAAQPQYILHGIKSSLQHSYLLISSKILQLISCPYKNFRTVSTSSYGIAETTKPYDAAHSSRRENVQDSGTPYLRVRIGGPICVTVKLELRLTRAKYVMRRRVLTYF